MDLNPPQQTTINMPKGSNTKFYIIIGILSLLLALSLILNPRSFFQATSSPLVNSSLRGVNNSLLTNLSASINGKIIRISGKTLTVKNSQGVTGEVTVSDNILISRPNPDLTPATPSSDLKKIELNKDVAIFLSLVNGSLAATSITYMPPAPDPNAPLPSNHVLPPPSPNPQGLLSPPPLPASASAKNLLASPKAP